jgi:tetratricopeptide (TPR) repeat protein
MRKLLLPLLIVVMMTMVPSTYGGKKKKPSCLNRELQLTLEGNDEKRSEMIWNVGAKAYAKSDFRHAAICFREFLTISPDILRNLFVFIHLHLPSTFHSSSFQSPHMFSLSSPILFFLNSFLHSTVAMFNLGAALATLNKWSTAKRVYSEAFSALKAAEEPLPLVEQSHYAHVLFELDEKEEALTYFRQLIFEEDETLYHSTTPSYRIDYRRALIILEVNPSALLTLTLPSFLPSVFFVSFLPHILLIMSGEGYYKYK